MSAFGGAFGQPSSAFGAPASSAFGAPSSFGQSTQAAFGAAPSLGANPSGGLFGSSAQPQQTGFGAFGQSSAPFGSTSVFGASAAQSAPAFGASGAFGDSVFGSQPTSGFGGAQGGFGASSQPAFGSSGGAFGAGSGGSSLFGAARPPTGGAFGASASGFGQSQSGWGATGSTSAFGASGAFGAAGSGGGLFGSSGAGSSLFGNQNKGFGGASQGQMGTNGPSWQLTVEYDGTPGTASSKYHAISMMPAYREKSLEELRLEDYAIGNKGGTGAGTGGNSLFGQSAPSTGLFGSSAAGTGFGASSGGFGGSAGFGASSGGGLFGGSSGFGNTGGFGQSSAGGFGSSGAGFGTQSGGGVFGPTAAATGFGAQSGSGFGAGASGFGASGFGSGASGFGSGASGFGSGAGGFGTGASGFGGGGSGFGNAQSGGGNLFGQTGATAGFGAPQSQPLFGAPAQTGGGLFGAPAAPTGGSVFGAPASTQTTANLFGGAAQQGNLFGGGTAAATAPSLFGNNSGTQRPLFGSTGAASGFGFGAQPSGAGGLFGNTGNTFGQSTAGTGFGFGGGALGAQPNVQQSGQPSLFGNAGGGGQVVAIGQGPGNHPSLLNTATAVTQGHGGTIAPPGANYGTVLHNLQKLQGELAEQKRLLEQQAQTNTNHSQQTGSLSVVVLPSPPLVKLSANRWPSSSGDYGSSRTPLRTKMRSVVGRIGGATNKVSGTAFKLQDSVAKAEATLVPVTPTASSPAIRKMPFFSPQQFTGPKRRPLRSSEVTTPHKSTPGLLPVPETGGRALGRNPGSEVSGGKSRTPRPFARRSSRQSHADVPSEEPTARGQGNVDANGSRTPNGTSSRPNSGSRLGDAARLSHNRESSEGLRKKRGSGVNSTTADFMWSSPRPSSWSLKTPVDSVDQYDPEKYLPYQTREGFYTVPSMAELASRTMKELQMVENFTVGRKGYGQVRWIDPVDVRGLDIDVVVDIKRGEVAVYPDREAAQLDAPAIVTLEGMYKKDKRTGTPTSDEELVARYAKKLRAFCEENELRFVEYAQEGGRWTFEAPGFAE